MARTVDVRTVEGAVAGTVTLDDAIFGVQPNVPVMHQVATAQLAAARAGTHSTKTRAEVSGGGKKPFKQKGTGRARQGSTRAPHWAGGGVALGPKPRSYRQRTPRKMIQLALRGALSDRASEERLAVVDEWPWSAPKTKDAKAALAALGLQGKVLVVLDRDEDDEAFLSFRNLVDVQMILAGELNAYDVLCNDWVVFTLRTLPGGGEGMVPSDDTVSPESTVPSESAVSSGSPVSPSDDTPQDAVEADSAVAEDTDDEPPDTPAGPREEPT